MALLSNLANLIKIYIYKYSYYSLKNITKTLFKTISPKVHNYAYLKLSTPRPLDHEPDIKINYVNF